MMIANVWACILSFKYAPFGKYQLEDRMEMKKPTFTCGLDAALCVLGGKWKPLILFHLAHGTRRYGELRRAVGGVSDKGLIPQLKNCTRTESSTGSTTMRFRRRLNIPSRHSAER